VSSGEGVRQATAGAGAASIDEAAQVRLRQLLPDYELIRELGRGGTAVVYHARERALDRDVAIKVVHQTQLHDREAVGRLAREARLIAQLRHPNIVPLLGTRRLVDGSLALIMQYVPGRTLKQAIREDGPLPVGAAESVLREIAAALHYAHERHSVIHRDIKPENIYLDTEAGRSLLSDFGIARNFESDASLTIAGTALGTPAYMSPEQIDGLDLDGRSDLYSLGMVAYEMLTGQQPWAGHNLYAIIYNQKHEELPPISEFRRDVPLYLQHAIEGLLRKEREQRWSDAAQFISQLSPLATRRIAPPALTSRRRPAHENESPSEKPEEDTPTIVFRPEDVVPKSLPEPELHADATVPVIRFFLDGDDDDQVLRLGRPGRRARPARLLKRRETLLLGAAMFIVLAGAVVPMIALEEDAPAATQDADALPRIRPDSNRVHSVDGANRAARLEVLTDGQVGRAGRTLALPVGIRVSDGEGYPVSGAELEVRVVSGGGRVSDHRMISDEHGLATTQWTLGNAPGANELSVRIAGGAAAVAVHARATAAPPVATMPPPSQIIAVDR